MANGTLREGTCGLSWSPPCAVRVGQYLVLQTRSVCFLKEYVVSTDSTPAVRRIDAVMLDNSNP